VRELVFATARSSRAHRVHSMPIEVAPSTSMSLPFRLAALSYRHRGVSMSEVYSLRSRRRGRSQRLFKKHIREIDFLSLFLAKPEIDNRNWT
jgi:hypothetical protein